MNVIVVSIFALAAAAAGPSDKPADATAGKALFAAKCVACHAKDGSGNPKIAQMYKLDAAKISLIGEEARKLAAADVAKIVAEGKGKMKGLKDKIPEADIANVAAYVRSLAQAPATPAKAEASR